MIFNKDIWLDFWIKLQQDIADCLQDNILNFSSLVGLCMIFVHVNLPEYSKEIDAFATSYLFYVPTARKG